MDIQFAHDRRWRAGSSGTTLAVAVPDKGTLTAMLIPGTLKSIPILVGYSRCHPKDNFNKKLGRDKAMERLSLHRYILKEVHYHDDRISLTLKLDNSNNSEVREIILDIKPSRSRVWLSSYRLSKHEYAIKNINHEYE